MRLQYFTVVLGITTGLPRDGITDVYGTHCSAFLCQISCCRLVVTYFLRALLSLFTLSSNYFNGFHLEWQKAKQK